MRGDQASTGLGRSSRDISRQEPEPREAGFTSTRATRKFPRPATILAAGLLLASLATFASIWKGPGAPPPWPEDQSFIEIVDLRISKQDGIWQFKYPHLGHSGGISSSLTIGFYKLLASVPLEVLNHHAKSIAAALFFLGAGFLAGPLVRTWQGAVLLPVLVWAGGYQAVEPSSEVFAAAFFSLFLAGAVRGDWPFLSGVALSLFAVSKVECLLLAVPVALVWLHSIYERRLRWLAAGAAACSTAVLLLPGLYLYREWDLGTSRGIVAFAQHYAWLVVPESSAGPPDTWLEVFRAAFPSAETLWDVVRSYPMGYLGFLAHSIPASLLNLALGLLGTMVALLLFPLVRGHSSEALRLARLTAVCLAGTLLFAALSAVLHPRYLARVYPALALIGTLFVERLWAGGLEGRERAIGAVVLTALVLTVGIWVAASPLSGLR